MSLTLCLLYVNKIKLKDNSTREGSLHHIDKVFMENTKTWHAVLILWLEVLDAATDRGEFPVRGSPRSGNVKGGLETRQ